MSISLAIPFASVNLLQRCTCCSLYRLVLQAVMHSSTAEGLSRVLASGDTSGCPGLAAAILAVCFIRCSSSPALASATSFIIPSLRSFFETLVGRSGARAGVNGGSPRSTSAASGFAVSTADCDALYMGAALAKLTLPYIGPETESDAEALVNHVVLLLQRLLEHSEQYLPVSNTLTLLGDASKVFESVREELLRSGVLGKVCPPSSSRHLMQVHIGRTWLCAIQSIILHHHEICVGLLSCCWYLKFLPSISSRHALHQVNNRFGFYPRRKFQAVASGFVVPCIASHTLDRYKLCS